MLQGWECECCVLDQLLLPSMLQSINHLKIGTPVSPGSRPLKSTQMQETIRSVVPTEAKERKKFPVTTGVLDYFPDAILAVSEVSKIGNDQHNPGEPLHWAKGKSSDHADCITRHLLDRGKIDADGIRHSAKIAWRALALLQIEIEKERGIIYEK